jgi:hypothetical protein
MSKVLKHGLISLVIYLLAMTLLVIAFDSFGAQPLETSERFRCNSPECASHMIKYWVRLSPRHPLARPQNRIRFAYELASVIQEHEAPLALIASISFRESSGRAGLVGPAGELGEMQVHPDTAARNKCELRTPKQRIDCGTKILRKYFDKCGSWEGALTVYASKYGKCTTKWGSRLYWTVKNRFKLADKLEFYARSQVESTPQ